MAVTHPVYPEASAKTTHPPDGLAHHGLATLSLAGRPIIHMLTLFDPQPAATELPARFPSPFESTPHPIAQRAAARLVEQLRDWPGESDGGGKMFGVLVVAAPDGRVGFLRGFSGMLGRRWHVPGFVPPLFDVAARDTFWPAGEAALRTLSQQLAELDALTAPRRAELALLITRHDVVMHALRERHRARRVRRQTERESAPDDPEALRALASESRGDTAEQHRLRAEHAAQRETVASRLRAIDTQYAALAQERADRSRMYSQQIHDTYVIANARGERRLLRELFAPDAPPSGAGDCAAPKLLGHAYREGLRPIALAELWWGPPPITGGRHAGLFYPACRGKCGPLLGHALEGLATDPPPRFGGELIAADEPRVVFEDRWIAIVDKPVGLLSVPGRGDALRDSVLTRLRARYPQARGPLVVHRLDLDTSGLLLVAKDEPTHVALQRMFALRAIDKRYVAWLDGSAAGDRGVVTLALRVDIDDRPRQIYDPLHGKPATTEWQVIARDAGRTRVALYPRTGRTHQLRVHAAHALGIGVPITGDRLYGRHSERERLLLHAEALSFVHPHTNERVTIERPAPF